MTMNLTTVPITVESGTGFGGITVDREPNTGALRIVQASNPDGSGREVIVLTEEHAQALIGAISAMAPRRLNRPPIGDFEIAMDSGTEYGPVELAINRVDFGMTVLIRQQDGTDEDGRETVDTIAISPERFDLFLQVAQSFRDESLP